MAAKHTADSVDGLLPMQRIREVMAYMASQPGHSCITGVLRIADEQASRRIASSMIIPAGAFVTVVTILAMTIMNLPTPRAFSIVAVGPVMMAYGLWTRNSRRGRTAEAKQIQALAVGALETLLAFPSVESQPLERTDRRRLRALLRATRVRSQTLVALANAPEVQIAFPDL